MIFTALSEAADKDELLLVDGGLCRFHSRKDGVVVIREILVLPGRRRRGVGRELIRDVRERLPGQILLAKCPSGYVAGNEFWRGMGFELTATVMLPEFRGINTWMLLANREPTCNSSFAPTEIPATPG